MTTIPPFQPALQWSLRKQFGRYLHEDFDRSFGAVVGIVRVASCVPTETLFREVVGPKELAFGDYSPGRFAWICDRFHALPVPVPCKGRQALFQWLPTPDVILPEWATE